MVLIHLFGSIAARDAGRSPGDILAIVRAGSAGGAAAAVRFAGGAEQFSAFRTTDDLLRIALTIRTIGHDRLLPEGIPSFYA